MPKSTYFTDLDLSNATIPKSNTLVGDACGNDASFGVRLTTGQDDKLIVDISGADVTAGNTFRVSFNTIDEGTLINNTFDTTAPFEYDDCSQISGNLKVTSKFEGEPIDEMNNDSFKFRTLGSSAIRLTYKKAGYVQNGQKVAVYVRSSNGDAAYTFDIEDASNLKFNRNASTPAFALVNGGPSQIPDYTADIVRDGTSNDGKLSITTDSPLFANNNEGVKLSSVKFLLSKIVQGSMANQTALELTSEVIPTAAGKYVYQFSGTISDALTNAYLLQTTQIQDEFGVVAYVKKLPTNLSTEPLVIQNKARQISTGSINVDSDSSEGKKAVISFKGNGAPEGFATISKYSVYYLTVEQAFANKTRKGGDGGDKDVSMIKFEQVKALNQVQEISGDDLDKSKYDALQEVTLSNIANSEDMASEYAVFITASTSSSTGVVLEGIAPDAIAITDLSNATAALITDKSYKRFYVSGAPKAPTHVKMLVGKDIATNATDAQMSGKVAIEHSDFQTDMQGDNYDKLKYVIVSKEDYDANTPSFADASLTGNFNQNGDICNNVVSNLGAANVTYKLDASNIYVADNTSIKDGTDYKLQYAYNNNNGVGTKSAWYDFKPQTMPDVTTKLFAADPSGQTAVGGGVNVEFGRDNLELAQSEITTDLSAAQHGLEIGSGSIKFGWNFKTQHQINNNLDASATLTGGVAITGVRHSLRLNSIAPEAARIYGTNLVQVDNSFSQVPALSTNLNSLTITTGKDICNNVVGLQNGRRYDISLSLVNANGFDDTKNATVIGFAPMGPLNAPTGLVPGEASVTSSIVSFDMCFNDISGVANHGGHLITHYDVKVEQYVRGDTITLQPFDSSLVAIADAPFVTGSSTIRKLNVVTNLSDGSAGVPGYPMKVFLRAVAKADTTGSADEQSNLLYNKNRADAKGAVASLDMNGPKMTGNKNDEVNSLTATALDKSIKINFSKPQAAQMSGLGLTNPVVSSYKAYLYDMSLATIATTQQASSRQEKTLDADNDFIPGLGGYQHTFNNLKNGGAYLVSVQTTWRYGAPGNQLTHVTQGVYDTSPFNHTADVDPSLIVGTSRYTWGVASTDASGFFLRNPASGYLVPSGPPSIAVDATDASKNYLSFDDNGKAISNAMMFQVSPTEYTSGTDIFSQDISGAASVKTDVIGADGHETLRQKYTVQAASLGDNWLTEKNIVIVTNDNGGDNLIYPPAASS